MSFVICKRFDDVITMQSDTRGWHQGKSEKSPIFKGLLKLLIISPSICVGWAGSVETAKIALTSIDPEHVRNNDFEAICKHLALKSERTESGMEAEFIVACAGQPHRIFKVADEATVEVTDTAWIGNSDAFNTFQKHWNSDELTQAKHTSPQEAFDQAFINTLMNSSTKTVGDFQINVGARDKGFRYGIYGETHFPTQHFSSATRTALLHGTARGGYAISCLAADHGDKQGCALYFVSGNFGIILRSEKPFEFSEVIKLPRDKFVEYAKVKFGLALQGFICNEAGRHLNVGNRAIEIHPVITVTSDSNTATEIQIKKRFSIRHHSEHPTTPPRIDMSLHLSDLDELVQRVRSTYVREQAEEALKAYRAGAYRAAVVTTWIAVCTDIIEKIRELSIAGDGQSQVIEQRLDGVITSKDPSLMLAFERDILDIASEQLELIPLAEKIQLERLKDDRNFCAHPTFQQDGKHFSPPPELARLYIVQSCQYLLTQAPTKGKSLIEDTYTLINEESFPQDDEGAHVLLSSDNHLGRARKSATTNLCIILLKRVFKDDESIPVPLMKRITAAMNAISRISPEVFSDVLRGKLPGLLANATDAVLKRMFPFVEHIPESWGYLDDASRVRVSGLIPTLSASDIVNYRVASAAGQATALAEPLWAAVNNFDTKGKNTVLSGPPSEALKDLAIDFFIDSGSFDSAIHRGENHLLPHAQYFNISDLNRTLEGAAANKRYTANINQILGAGGIDNILCRVYEKTKRCGIGAPAQWKAFVEENELVDQLEELTEALRSDALLGAKVDCE